MHTRMVATDSKIITQDSQGNYFKPNYGQQHTYDEIGKIAIITSWPRLNSDILHIFSKYVQNKYNDVNINCGQLVDIHNLIVSTLLHTHPLSLCVSHSVCVMCI